MILTYLKRFFQTDPTQGRWDYYITHLVWKIPKSDILLTVRAISVTPFPVHRAISFPSIWSEFSCRLFPLLPLLPLHTSGETASIFLASFDQIVVDSIRFPLSHPSLTRPICSASGFVPPTPHHQQPTQLPWTLKIDGERPSKDTGSWCCAFVQVQFA